MQTEELDILCVAETHLRAGNQEDLSMLSGYYITTLDRTFGEKGGGGMMAIVNPNLNHMIWNSPDERFPELSNEKFWILIHEGGTKVAVGAVYMAAQVTNNDAFKEWNVKLYSMLEHDTRMLTDKGYKCFILGDFNGHIGCDEDGIAGNKEKTNSNGVLLQQFIKNNALTLLNADPRITAGMFTRTAGGNTTILDYGLASKEGVGLIDSMSIDENGNIMAGSDHAALILKLKLKREHGSSSTPREKINIPNNPDYDVFHFKLDEVLSARTEGYNNIDEHCIWLQQSLISAGILAYGTRNANHQPCRKVSLPKSIRKLRQERKVIARLVKRKSILKLKNRVAGQVWSDKDNASLNTNLDKLNNIQEQLNAHLLNHKLNKRTRTRTKTKFGTKEFWNLANRVMRKSSELNAVEAENGDLITDKALLEETVLEDLSKIFMGQKSKIFVHKGQQLIKAAKVKYQEDHQDWIPDDVVQDKHEDEVCKQVTIAEIKKIVQRNKDSRASGVDDLPTLLFKNASELFYEELTELVNSCLIQGETPECLNTGKMTLIDKKEPSLKVSKKRPLTVSSQIQSVITRLLAQRMDKVCERERLYGSTQYGFRSGKSTTDCIFLLLAALRKARKKKYQISIAFCDLQKAYDSVDREILYKKLASVGFGGLVLSLIQSMYFNDNIQVRLGDRLSAPYGLQEE